jgi:hypothetical protein
MTHTTHHSRSRKKGVPASLIVVALSVVLAICLPSKAAAAKAPAPSAEGPALSGVPRHIEPEAFDRRSKKSVRKRVQQQPVVYRGGRVQDYTKTYVIFWLPAGYTFDTVGGSSYYEGLLTRYLTDINASSFYNTVTQYGDSYAWIRPNSTLADVVLDTTPYPVRSGHVFTIDSDIQAEVVKWIRARGWVYGLHEQFLVYTATGVETWDPDLGWSTDPKTGYCAYHSYFSGASVGLGNYPIVYANMPDQEGQYSCYAQVLVGKGKNARPVALAPNGDPAADSEVSITSHEQFESITDPQLNAWADAQGNEVADKCAYQYGALAADGGNVTLNGHRYVLQGEWSNAPVGRTGGGCSWYTALPFHGQ